MDLAMKKTSQAKTSHPFENMKHASCHPFLQSKRHQYYILKITGTILILTMLVGCGPSPKDLKAIEYVPLTGAGWKVSTPIEQGLDPMLVAKLYYNAANLETIYGLLVIKNSCLIAEKYFNKGSLDQKARLQSMTKSFTSALVGIALNCRDIRILKRILGSTAN